MKFIFKTMVIITILFLMLICKVYAKEENRLSFTVGVLESFFSENANVKKVNLNENKKIQPGESGYFDIEINLYDYYSNINYTIIFSNLKNKPNNLEFIIDNQSVNLEKFKLDGQMENNTRRIIKRIYWNWKYEGEDNPPINHDEITFDISLNWEKEKKDFMTGKLPRTGSDLITYLAIAWTAIVFIYIKSKH